mmetsp:Transcript_16216/g.38872  ORF Transcript_16216/g.38872 Transcript_16216/m.38872 type:complete len:119 (+) Transcript_16216:740-1096(+)
MNSSRNVILPAPYHKVCFSTPIQFGDLCTVRAAVTFTSERSCEVVAQVWKSPSGIVGGLPDDHASLAAVCAVEARFIFVALDNNMKVVSIPELPVEKQRTKRWEVGASKHKERSGLRC